MKEVVVISGKGGTGKTSLVAGLAATGPAKVLADCDVDASDLHLVLEPEILETNQFMSGELASIDPDLCSACGLCRDHCRFRAISEDFRILQEHCQGCALCFHVCPERAVSMHERHCGEWFYSETRYGPMLHARLGIGQENSGRLVTLVRRESRKLAMEKGLEAVLCDGSPGVGCPVIASLTNADLALMVAEPSLSAFADLRRVLELARHFDIPCLAVINKADINHELTLEIESFCSENRVGLAAKLPYDPDFTRAQINGQSIVEYSPGKWGYIMQDIWKVIKERLNGS